MKLYKNHYFYFHITKHKLIMNEENKEFEENAKQASDEVNSSAKEFSDGAKGALNNQENKKVLVGILAIVLGGLGVHKFLLGYNKEGIILASITLIGFVTICLAIGVFIIWVPWLIGLIEGIIYLTKSDEEFYNTYQVGRKPWF